MAGGLFGQPIGTLKGSSEFADTGLSLPAVTDSRALRHAKKRPFGIMRRTLGAQVDHHLTCCLYVKLGLLIQGEIFNWMKLMSKSRRVRCLESWAERRCSHWVLVIESTRPDA